MPTGAKGKKSFDLRQLIGPRERILDAEAGSAVASVYALVSAIYSEGFETALRFLMKGVVDPDQPAMELVADLAEHLSHKLTGLKADVFRKAVQEAMLDAASVVYDPQKLNFKVRLEKYLRKRGAKEFLVMFLSRYVFNTVWIKIQEPIRSKSGSQALNKSMVSLARFCTSVVRSVIHDWHEAGKLEELTTKKRLGNNLIKTIETRLFES